MLRSMPSNGASVHANARLVLALVAAFSLAACVKSAAPEAAAPAEAAPAASRFDVAQVAAGQGPSRLALPVLASEAEAQALLAAQPALQSFLSNEGRGWTVSFDRRSGQPMLLQGPGIAWTPGAGNTLDTAAVFGHRFLTLRGAARVQAISATVEARGRDLLSKSPFLTALSAAPLALDRAWTGSPDEEGQTFFATFRPNPAGLEQHGARVTFVVRHGNLVSIHAEQLATAPANLQPKLTSDAALRALRTAAKIPDTLSLQAADLQIVSLAATAEAPGVYSGALGQGYEAHLAYSFRFKLPGDHKTYAAFVDAQSGELLDLYDDNKYGEVSGGIYPRTSGSSELIVPFVDTKVSNGTDKVTDLGGNYPYAGGLASTALSGANMNVKDNCGAANASTSGGTGELGLGTSAGTDCSFSATSGTTRSGRNAFYHLNNVRRMMGKWLSGYSAKGTSWLGTDVGVNVNISDTCNAYWDGSSVNFFRSGGGCANTGEISDVMQHELGHGLDQNTKSAGVGDPGKGEAVADTVALLMTHDSCVGPGFFSSGKGGETAACPSGVRDLAFVVTQANIKSVCTKSTSCAGALGYECHCESHLLSGAHWQLAKLFVQRYGTEEGWNLFERGFLHALPNITAYLPNTAGNAYDAWMTADDDNGNLTDGTPNADLIFQAFNAQGLAGTQRPKSAACTAPASPVVTAAAQVGSVALSWAQVAGATTYSIFRTQAHNDGQGFLPLAANVTAASYTDAQVAPGAAYSYQVVAVSAACQSAYGAGVTATPTAAGPASGANDFSVAITPATPSIVQGASAAVAVATKVTSGSAASVSLSVSGLPSGVTGSFSPASVTAGQSSTLTLSAATSAAVASASFTVTGTAGSTSHAAGGTVSVTKAGSGGGGTCPSGTTSVGGVCVPTGCATSSGSAGWLAAMAAAMLALVVRRRRN